MTDDRSNRQFNWCTTNAAAQRLGGVSCQQVYEWIEVGELTAFDASRKPGVTRPDWRFKDEWLAEFEVRRTRLRRHESVRNGHE